MTANAPECAHCKGDARLVSGDKVYPHRPDLYALKFWVCDDCDARVGCHKPGARTELGESDGTMPLGTPANRHLRGLRSGVHRVLDPLWQCHKIKRENRSARRRVYRILARELGLDKVMTHVAMFDERQCRKAYAILKNLTPERVLVEGRFDPQRDREDA